MTEVKKTLFLVFFVKKITQKFKYMCPTSSLKFIQDYFKKFQNNCLKTEGGDRFLVK